MGKLGHKRASGRSPYKKHNKAPYRYSKRYYEWRALMLKGETNKAAELYA